MRGNYPEPLGAIGRTRRALLAVSLGIAVATPQPPVPMAFPMAEAIRGAHARHRNAYPHFLVMSYIAASHRAAQPEHRLARRRVPAQPEQGWLGGEPSSILRLSRNTGLAMGLARGALRHSRNTGLARGRRGRRGGSGILLLLESCSASSILRTYPGLLVEFGPDRQSYGGPVLLAGKHSAEAPLALLSGNTTA